MTASDATTSRDSFQRTVVAPVSLLVAAMIVAVIAAAIWVARHQTADLLARERSLAESALAERLSVLEKTTDDYAYWDEAVAHARLKDDAAWVDANVARPVADKYGFGLVSIVDGRGQAVFGARGDVRFTGPLDQALAGGFATLLGRLSAGTGRDTATDVLWLDDTPALVAVSRIRPFSAEAPMGPLPERFLVFVDALDAARLASVAKAYRLPELHVAKAKAVGASILIGSADGTRNASLVWRGSDPGGELLASILPILIALLIAFACLTAYVLRQGRAAAIRLHDSERRALLDPLTGLPNRLMLFARCEELLAANDAKGFAVAYLDLDGFKQVNDALGHDAGDEVLRETARRMTAAIRDGDLLARIGGDEFAMLLPDLTEPAAMRQLAERVIASVREPIAAGGATAHIGVTIGVAVAPSDARDTLALIKAADAALYRAKRNAKGTVQFSLTA